MTDKSAQLFQLEVAQSVQTASGDPEVHVSRLSVVNLPASEILNEDPETVRIQQGPTLNKAIFSLSSLFRDLSATPHGDYANYDDSMLTSLTRDVFGGNSLCLGVFSLAFGDSAGSL
jgi:hypothetical protein